MPITAVPPTERSGGFVAKYMGDGVLAYFGYPRADENDVERAVQAGLALIEAVPKLETAAGSSLHLRVEIATGLVVVGDLIGSGAAQEQAVRLVLQGGPLRSVWMLTYQGTSNCARLLFTLQIDKLHSAPAPVQRDRSEQDRRPRCP